MAKKKERKDKDKKKFEYSNEVIGIILILASLLGIGGYGPAGNFIRSFGIFLVGILYIFFFIALLIFGLYLIVKREKPKMFTSRLIGLYIITLSVLILLHMQFIINQGDSTMIITETFNNVLLSFKSEIAVSNCGGGMIGGIFSYFFYMAFKEGTYIVVIALIILGLILLLNTGMMDFVRKIKEKLSIFKRKEKVKDEEESKVIVSSVADSETIKEESDDIPIAKIPVVEEGPSEVNSNYQLPPLSLLKSIKNTGGKINEQYAKESIEKLEKVLEEFEIKGKVVHVNIGPTVTQYELELKAGTKVNKLLSIQREIALSLAAKNVRIQAPIPGKNTIGIELPNKTNMSVSFKEILSNLPEVSEKSMLAVGLGKDIMGRGKWAEINATPHLLVAGATGSGKSVCINCIIASLLMRTKPDEVKLVLVDPKKVELTMYNGIPHLLAPVVTDPKKASIALKNIVAEMERRYDLFEHTKNKNITAFNKYCETHEDYTKLPYIVVIIDELADLMLVAAKEVEDSIMRITQMARAAGIHLIVATQRPSTDVITGVVKANIPSRISFAVSSSIDSRTILDATGAEKLLGKGDMLFLPMGENIPLRLQGAYVSEEELQKIVDYTIKQQKASYDESLTVDKNNSSSVSSSDGYSSDEEYEDPLYNEVVDFAIQTGKISASLVQRKYRLGYNRAARIIDLLEERGIIGPQNGSKPREVLVKKEEENDE